MRTILVCSILAACSTSEPAAPDGGTDTIDVVPEAATGMTVVGNQLRKDGALFMPRGFNMIGALSPAWCTNGTGVAARNHFNATELNRAITGWHANTIRLQVSQRGLGDASRTAAERTAYLQHVQDDVALARSLGLVVILSMQDQSIGCGPAHPLPTQQTIAAWRKLAPAFASQPYVMFELFNEPQNETTDTAWNQWRNGGTQPLANLGDPAVGMQQLVTTIRTAGAKNVLLADAARLGEHLDNITPHLLAEKTGGRGIAYAVHPYYYAPGQAYWQTSWGFLTATHAVIATEWNYKADDCGKKQETLAPALLAWLNTKHIGITAHAFDAIGTLVADWSWTPTSCATASGGAGAVLKAWYAQLAQ